MSLERKIALVTGSTRGLGRVIAETLAKEGVEVIINGRHEQSVYRAANEISEKYKIQTWLCPVDITDGKAVKKFFQRWPTFPEKRLDILVNNAGNIEKFGLLMDLEEEDYFRAFDLTFMSMVRFSRAAYLYLKASGNGRIINIGSIPAHQPGRANPHYAAAKGALLPQSKMMATEWAKDNILVNVVCPSTLRGGGWHQNIKLKAQRDGISEQEAEELMLGEESLKSPLGRIGKLEDVANLVAFLASDKAGFITGQCFNVDGGLTRSIL